jgi:hypothetical protein
MTKETLPPAPGRRGPISWPLMSALGQTRSFGDVGSMSGLPESGHDWAIYEYTPESSLIESTSQSRSGTLKIKHKLGGGLLAW